MGLSAQNVAIVPTPSGILDGHYPDGNDGSGAIPLTWATIPSFLQKQVGTPFSIDLFAAYLTQPGGATASITPGFSITGGSGWSLNAAGVLSYSGTGSGSSTIRVRATSGANTADSNVFTIESIPVVAGDTLPPTWPTGLAMVSKTAVQVVVNTDVPSDVSTSGVTASGLKEVRYFKGGVFDGVTSYTPGLLQRLQLLNMAPAGGGRRMPMGALSTISKTQHDNAGTVPSYAVGPGIAAVIIRYRWGPDLEPGAAGGYTLNQMKTDVLAAKALGVQFIAMIECRTFDAANGVNPMPPYLADNCSWFISGTNQPANSLIATVTGNVTSGSTTISSVSSTANIVDGGGLIDSNGSISPSARVVSHTANTIVMDRPALSTKNGDSVSYYQKPTGYQGWRWYPAVLTAYQNLVNAIGLEFDNPATFATYGTTFAGIATQETSNGGIATGVGGYSPTVYANALISEQRYINAALPNGRGWYYCNFMSGTGTTAALNSVITALISDGKISVVGFPDLGNANSGMSNIVNNVYPMSQTYHNAGGYTFGAVQQSEWTANNNPSFPQLYMSELYNYATASATYPTAGYPATVPDWSGAVPGQTSPLKLDAIVYNVQQSLNGLNEKFDPTIIGTNGIAKTNAVPWGTLQAPSGSSMTPGSASQTNANYTVTSFGTGIGTANDQWACVSNSMNGDGTVIVRLTSLTGTDMTSGPTMGVCIREGTTGADRAVYAVSTGTLLRTRYRLSAGAAVTNALDISGLGYTIPTWVKINRTGNLFTFSYSTYLSWYQSTAGNYDPTFVPTAANYYYCDLNAPPGGTGLTPDSPKNTLPASITSGMQLFFNADSTGPHYLGAGDNVFSIGTVSNFQIGSYSTTPGKKAVLAAYTQFINDSGWTQIPATNVWYRTYNGTQDATGDTILGGVFNMASTTESPQGDILHWTDMTNPGAFNPNTLPSNSYAFDYRADTTPSTIPTAKRLWINLGGTDPRTVTIALGTRTRFIQMNGGATPFNFTIHDLRLIGFSNAAINIVQNSHHWRVHHNELYGNGGMWTGAGYLGSGVQMGHNANNGEVDNNVIIQTYDSPTTPQHFGGNTNDVLHDINIHHNTIQYWALAACEIADWGSPAPTNNQINNITFQFNRCTGGGVGFSGTGDGPQNITDGVHFRGYGGGGTVTGISIHDNTIQTHDSDIGLHAGVSTDQIQVYNNNCSTSTWGFKQDVTTMKVNLHNNLFGNCGTAITPASAAAGSTYASNTTQGPQCDTPPILTQGFQTPQWTWTSAGSATVAMQPTVYVQLFAATTGTSSVTGSFQQLSVQNLAKINYTFAGLTTGTAYTFTAVARDIALNDSIVGSPLLVTTS